MTTPRLLRVVPATAGGWDVVQPGTRAVVGHADDEAAAVECAVALLTDGGGIEVLNSGGFVVGRRSVPPPPESVRSIVVGLVVQVGIYATLALVLGWIFDSLIPAGSLLGVFLFNLVQGVRRLRAARRAPF